MPGSLFETGAAVLATGPPDADGIDTARRGMGGSIGVAATLSAVVPGLPLLAPDRSGDTGGALARVARASGGGLAGAAATGGAGGGATATGGGAGAGATGAGGSGRPASGPSPVVKVMDVGSGRSDETRIGSAGVSAARAAGGG